MNLPSISIIIPTYNSEKVLPQCLESIRMQDYPKDKVEIIIVDNYSSDTTAKIAREYTDKVFNKGPERSAQRNFGAKIAKGDYLLFIDSDMLLSKSVLKDFAELIQKNEDIIAANIPEIIIGKGFWIKVRNFERSFYNNTCIDAVRFIRKDVLLEIGGFDEAFFAGEDWDLDRRIREIGDIGILSVPLYHIEEEFKLINYLKKKTHYSKNLQRYIQKWGKEDPIIKKQLGVYYRLIGVFIEHHKWKKLLRHPALTICMYVLRFMVGMAYLFTQIKSIRV